MSSVIQNSASIKHMKRQTLSRNEPITRKRIGELEQMQGTEMFQLSSPSPQKKGSLAELSLIFYLIYYFMIYVKGVDRRTLMKIF